MLFRSPDPWSSWVLSLLAVMDAAAMHLALQPDSAPSQARMCLRMGYVALRRISRSLGWKFDDDPLPDGPIELTVDEFIDRGRRSSNDSGFPIERDADSAWPHFRGWRVNYEDLRVPVGEPGRRTGRAVVGHPARHRGRPRRAASARAPLARRPVHVRASAVSAPGVNGPDAGSMLSSSAQQREVVDDGAHRARPLADRGRDPFDRTAANVADREHPRHRGFEGQRVACAEARRRDHVVGE